MKVDSALMEDSDEEQNKENGDIEMKSEDNEKRSFTQYLVKAVIRKKILFNKRPRPIVFEMNPGANSVKFN